MHECMGSISSPPLPLLSLPISFLPPAPLHLNIGHQGPPSHFDGHVFIMAESTSQSHTTQSHHILSLPFHCSSHGNVPSLLSSFPCQSFSNASLPCPSTLQLPSPVVSPSSVESVTFPLSYLKSASETSALN